MKYSIGVLLFVSLLTNAQRDSNNQALRHLQGKITALVAGYENVLGVYKNPFLGAFTVEDANAVYDTLLRRSSGLLCSDSPLFKIQDELKSLKPKTAKINVPLLEEVIEDAELLLSQDNDANNRHDLQSNLLALQSSLDYLYRFMPVEKMPDNEKKPDQPKKEEKKPDQPEKKVEYPDASDAYNPHTKELQGDKSKQKKTVVVEVDFITPLLGQTVYTQIVRNHATPFKTSARPWDQQTTVIGKADADARNMIVHPLGKRQVKLFVTPGYMPAQAETPGVEIRADGMGGYNAILAQDYEHFVVPLNHLGQSQLSAFQQAVLTEPVGFDGAEWPGKIKSALLDSCKPDTHDHAAIAKAVAQHISHNYLYSTGARPELDPIDALKAGAFQCDMAAYIMVSILRDVYKIPCRSVSGYRAKKYQNGKDGKSYLALPEDGHAWVEVFHDGSWHPYDPTPIKKDKPDEKDQEENKSEYSSISLDDTSHDETSDDNPSQEKTDEQAAKKTDKEPDKKEEKPAAGEGNKSEEQKPYFLPDLVDTLSNLNIEDDPANPLRTHMLKVLLIELLNPLKNSDDANHRLNLFKSLYASYEPRLSPLLGQALRFNKDPHDHLIAWLKQIEGNIFSQDINKTYQDCVHINSMLALYKKIVDCDDIKMRCDDASAHIDQIIHDLLPLKDKDAGDLALAEDFKDQSPDLLWKTIQRDYSLATVGQNGPTHEFAKDVKAGKHNDKLLLNALYDHTNFILNSANRAGILLGKTWLRDKRKVGRDLLPLQRLDDWTRALMTNPSLDLVESIQQGASYVLAKRIKVPIATAKKELEAERMTIVGFDTSGSMAGRHSEFQAALIAAFVCRALSDISPLGKHRHRILLVPFDDKVGKTLKVTNVQEALNLISGHQELLKNTGGGTDIQGFMLQAFKLIAEAQDNKHPFETANIILMTDGEAPIDYEELRRARESIHRDTPLQTMFVAIGQTNPELQKFSLESKRIGAEKGFYSEFNSYEIDKIVNDARSFDPKKYESYYYSSESAEKIPARAKQHAAQAGRKASELAEAIHERLTVYNYKNYLERLAQNKPQELYNKRKLEHWIYEVRQMIAKYKAFHDERSLNFMLYNLMIKFERIGQVRLTDLNHHENEQLVHLLENPLHVT